MKSIKRCIVLSVLLMTVISAYATSWNGTGTNWSDSFGWDSGEPTADVSAVIWNGTVTVTESGEICKSLQLAGGASNFHGHVIITSGSLEVVNTMQIGPVGYGTVNMTDGLLKAKTIVLSQDRYNPSYIDISGNAEIQCYHFEVGWPGVGYVTQNGGTITTNELALTNYNDNSKGEGYYTLSAGTLNVGAVHVGIIKGKFEVTNPGVTVNVTDGFDIYPNGMLTVPNGTVLHLKGAKFSCRKTDSSQIPDLANLTLSYESGDDASECSLEAAGMDRGANAGVLVDNFAVAAVSIEPGINVRLINLVDNNTSDPVADAACAQQLVLCENSQLVLGNLNMYCQDWTNTCGTVDWRGTGRLYVLNAMYNMTMSANPSEIANDGVTESTISTTLTDRGTPLCNAYVCFRTDKGTLIADNTGTVVWTKTDAAGKATVRLRSGTETGTAAVTASYMDYSKQIMVDFVGLALTVSADPPMIPADAESCSVITAKLTDIHIPVSGQTVHFHTPEGAFVGEDNVLVSDIDVMTDEQGLATVLLQSDTEPKAFLVTAIYLDLEAQVEVHFVGYDLTVDATPNEVLSDGIACSTITAQLKNLGQPIIGETITFSTTLGQFVTPGSGTLVSSISLVTNDSGYAGVNLVSDTIGDATVTATYENLTAGTDVHFAMSLLSIEANPNKITADGTEMSIVTATLLIDGQPAQGETIWFHTTVGMFYDPIMGDFTADAWDLTDSDGHAAVALVPVDNREESGLVSAEYLPNDLHDTCIVEMRNYSLELTAEKGQYCSVPGIRDPQYPGSIDPVELSFPRSYTYANETIEFDYPLATLFGQTVIPVELDLTGPDVEGKTIHLVSEMKDLHHNRIRIVPDSVTTDHYGRASFKIYIEDIYLDLLSPGSLEVDQGSFAVDLKVSMEDRPEVSVSVDFPLFNNYIAIVKTFERNALDGFLWDLTDPYNRKYWSMAWPLIVSGVWAGDVNNTLDAIWTIDGLITGIPSPYGPFTCGCYQLMTLEIWDRMRLNQYGMTTSWLMNGFDYGPIMVLWGGHQAAMIWPQNRAWYDTDWCRVFDAWIAQYPEGGEYSLGDWLKGMGVVIPGVGWLFNLFLEPGSSNYNANKDYPPNSPGTYPNTINSGSDCAGERIPYATILLHCPVNVMVSNAAGQQVGVIPETPEGQNPYINEIENAEFYPQRLPDGSMAYALRIPRQNMNIDVSGYADGEFTMTLQDGNGKVFGYSEAPILIDQHVLADLEPNSLMAPAIAYPDGSLILPDDVIVIESWQYDKGQHQSRATLKVTNLTAVAVHGPMRLSMELTLPDTITLVNPDGTDEGKAYLDLTALLGDSKLDPGQTISRSIEFSNPNREKFDLSVKLTGRTEEDKSATARRTYKLVGIPQCSRDGLLPFDMAEGNAADWETWVEDMEPEGTFVFDDTYTLSAGSSSVMCVTNAPFDMYIRYGQTLTEPWDLSSAEKLFVSFYTRNENTFQNGSPWIRLKTDDDNYFQYQYYLDSNPYDFLNDCLWQWKAESIALDASESEENGWRRTTVGSPDWSQIRYLEIHADTWDSGFQLGVDGVGFDTDRAIYRDFNSDCNVDTLDLAMLAEHWLCTECAPTACEGVDIDLSKKVDLEDFVLFAEYWLVDDNL